MSNAPILLLESDPATRRQLTQAASSINQSTYVADSPTEAIQTLQSTASPLAIIDVLYPGIEPYTFVQQLRQARGSTRIMVIGENVNPAAITELLRRGASDFMPKPLSDGPLISRLEENIRIAAEAQLAAAFSASSMGMQASQALPGGFGAGSSSMGYAQPPQTSGLPGPPAPGESGMGYSPGKLPGGFRAPAQAPSHVPPTPAPSPSPPPRRMDPNRTNAGMPRGTSNPGYSPAPSPAPQTYSPSPQTFSPAPQTPGGGAFDLTGVAPPPREKHPEDADLSVDARRDLVDFLDHVLQQYLAIEQENMRLHRRVMALEDPGFAAKQKRTPSVWIAHADPEFAKGMLQLAARLDVDFRPPLATGGEILDKLSSMTPDLIVLGDTLHDIPGEFVVDTIRSEYSHVACIVVNGWGSPQMTGALHGPGGADSVDMDLRSAEDLISLIERAKQRIFDADVGVEFASEFKERHDEFLKRYAAIKSKVSAS